MTLRRKSPWLALAVLTTIATVGFIDRIVVNVLVEPLKIEFGLTDFQVSMMAWAFALLNVVGGLVTARFAERVRRLSLISAGVIIWSVATALCGAAGSWTQLLAARMGVGLGEAIGLPANQSVIADYFPASKRGFAISCLLLSPPLGAFFGFVGGGWIAQEFGWQMTFLIAAVPGFIMGFIAWFFIAEPKRGQHDVEHSEDVPSFGAFLSRLFRTASTRNLVIGSFLASGISYALNFFFASLMVRKFGMGLAEAGLYAGIIASLPAVLSILGAGWLGDRLGAQNPAAYALIPGTALLIGGPLYAFGIMQDDLAVLLMVVGGAIFLTLSYLGITYAAVQNLMHPRMRASAAAVLTGVYTLAGGIGPSLLGALSDWFATNYGPGQGLAMAMAVAAGVYVWSAVHYGLAARHLPRDTAAVQALS